MDLSAFDEKYKNDETGRLTYDHKILWKPALFAYLKGLTVFRKIGQSYWQNVVFMELSCGQNLDHSTIAAYVS